MKKYDAIIIGAGASGLFCAISAISRKKSVLILDHVSQAGQKIKISGGGRCNFTNLNATYENYVSKNPKFCISALSQFTPHDFFDLIKKNKISYTEKKSGQLFCKNSSIDIINMLVNELGEKTELKLNTTIKSVEKINNHFEIQTNDETFESKSVVIATGGLSFKKLGASDFGYKIAKQFGHKIIQQFPALDSFILSQQDLFKNLFGISLPVNISCRKKSFTDDLLFTHKGISGPAVLQVSSYWKKGDEIYIDFSPKYDLYDLLKNEKKQRNKRQLLNILSRVFSRRFSSIIIEKFSLSKPLAEMKDVQLKKLADQLHNWKIIPLKTQGYDTAEITRGGVDTNEISSKTMESKKISNLYFIGEVLDVAGHLGGYNLQWAWSSGFVAGQNIGIDLSK